MTVKRLLLLGFGYPYDGPLLTSATWSNANFSGGSASVQWGYDNNLRVTSEQVNNASNVAVAYDSDGLLSSAGGLTITRATSGGLPLNAQVVATTLGTAPASDAIAYDGYDAVAQYTAHAGATTLYDVTYGRDALGRIVDLVESVQGQASSSYHYTYDLAGRLVDVSGTSSASYLYDANGNRTDRVTPLPIHATYDAQDRLSTYGTTSYTYTDSGELHTKTVSGTLAATYTYDALGSLRSVVLPGKTIDYTVDGQGRRIWKQVNGVKKEGYVYGDDLRIVAEFDGTGSLVARFIYALHRNVPDAMVKGGVTYRIYGDHRGSPRLVVNSATGVVAQRIDYDEFGNVVSDSAPGFQPFGFAGGLYDTDTKLVRFGARDYDAETGRWTNKDPLGFGGRDTNLYRYCANDALNCTDPRGLAPGDHYESPLDAALHALADYNFQSIAINREFAGLIYQMAGGGYSYTRASVEDPGTGNTLKTLNQLGPGDVMVGGYHTHAAYTASTDEEFSPQDMLTADALGSSKYGYREFTSFLATPHGRVGIYKGDQNPFRSPTSCGFGLP